MKKIFIFPIKLSFKAGLITTNPKFSIYFWYYKSKMAGTMKTTTHYFNLKINNKNRQMYICWRPDVTRYWWKNGSKI